MLHIKMRVHDHFLGIGITVCTCCKLESAVFTLISIQLMKIVHLVVNSCINDNVHCVPLLLGHIVVRNILSE